MQMISLEQTLKENNYPGRGIVIGRSKDGSKAVTAYFIMGRSSNSRNRIFVEEGEGLRTQAFDPSKMEDPSLIIYAPVRVLEDKTIVTNGDQTDTIYDGMKGGLTFEQSLRSREFEPDAPNYTPRISGVMYVKDGGYHYEMSILTDGYIHDPDGVCTEEKLNYILEMRANDPMHCKPYADKFDCEFVPNTKCWGVQPLPQPEPPQPAVRSREPSCSG